MYLFSTQMKEITIKRMDEYCKKVLKNNYTLISK